MSIGQGARPSVATVTAAATITITMTAIAANVVDAVTSTTIKDFIARILRLESVPVY